MTKNRFQNRQIERQKGAALIVGLIVLFIMTIIGMSGMGSITNQLKMSSNLQTHNAAFQAASGAIQKTLDDGTSTIDWTLVTPQGPVAFDASDGSSRGEAMVVYTGCRNVPIGYDLTKAESFKGVIHDVDATGNALSGVTTVATSQQVKGVQTVRPGCPG